MRRSLRHPIRGDRMHPRPPARAARNTQWHPDPRKPRLRPRRGVNVSSIVGNPEDEPSRPNLRLRVVGLTVVALFFVLVLRLWTLQVIDSKSYAAAVVRNQVRVVSIQAPRGQIVDRAGTVLVSNTPQQEVLLSQTAAAAHPDIIGKVAALVGQTPKQVKASINNDRYSPYEPIPVALGVSAATVQYLETNQANYPGVSVETVTQRTYPQGGSVGTHLLGYVGDIPGAYLKDHPNDGYTQGSLVGLSGVEYQYEQYLKGVNGRQALSVNANGVVVGTVSKSAPELGDTLVLNLDAGLQAEVENALANQIATDRHTPDTEDGGKLPPAVNGAAIVLDPQNGQVLAMASWPTYDLDEWVGGISNANYEALNAGCTSNTDTTGCPLINYAIEGQYTPGSTFKLITATAALQDGVITANQYYDDTLTYKVPNCTGGTCNFKDDPGDGGGEVNMPLALTVSSDSYFYNLGNLFWEQRGTLGPDAIQNVAAEYGEGQITGIDIPGESQGRVDSQAERIKLHNEAPTAFPTTTWYAGDNIEMAFGQGGTVLTPIEQATAYATFANGGTRYAPEVANAIVDPLTGKVIKQFTPVATGHVNLPASISGPILQGLEGVISNPHGTAYSAFEGFPASWNLAGKTGTATNPGKNEPNSWFVAFGPNPNPQYVVLAVIDQGGYGAQAAAPLVRSIFNYLLTNEVSPSVKIPTPSNPASTAPPKSNPPAGATTTTTSTTAPAKTSGSGTTTTTSTQPAATTTTPTTAVGG
ncbi:MAG TPA: penicillin-binding protein 2 [Acidimicrobiales bacterium]